jgi:hypothetical protein
MCKDEALWIVIRAAGLVFLVLTIISFVKLVSGFFYFFYMTDVFSAILTKDVSKAERIAVDLSKTMISNNLTNIILYGIAAYYFMRKGKFVHKVIAK